jgi:molecular chaperone GrpE
MLKGRELMNELQTKPLHTIKLRTQELTSKCVGLWQKVVNVIAPPSKSVGVDTIKLLATVDQGVSTLEMRLNSLQELFENRFRYDETKERAFDTLYEKMRQYEGDYQASLKKNLVLALLLLHDNMQRIEVALCDRPAEQELVAELRQDLLDILYAEDVEPVGALGDSFDRHKQQVMQRIPTTDHAKDNKIERVVREGFVATNKVLRPQLVTVFTYQSPVSQG